MNEATGQATPFDFRKLARNSGGDLSEFREIQTAFAANLSSQLSGYLRAEFVIELEDASQLPWGDFAQRLETPTCLLMLNLRPSAGVGMLEIGSAFVFSVLEILLGGKPEGALDTRRELTGIERKLLDGFFQGVLKQLREAWPGERAAFHLESAMTQAPGAAVIAPDETMAVATFRVQVEGHASQMRLAVPLALSKPVRQKSGTDASAAAMQRESKDALRILERIRSGKLHTEIALSQATITIRDLAALEPGDVLNLQRPVARPLVMRVNGVDKFEGFVVPSREKRAFTVQGPHRRPR